MKGIRSNEICFVGFLLGKECILSREISEEKGLEIWGIFLFVYWFFSELSILLGFGGSIRDIVVSEIGMVFIFMEYKLVLYIG